MSLARGLTEIRTEALIGCSILRNLDTLSTTKVTKIGVRALKDTAGLTSISLPTSTFVSFAQSAFENSGVQKINNLKNCSKFKSFGASSFMNSGLKEIEFPNCTFSIEASAFKNCTALTKATFNSKTAPTAQETSFEGTTSALQVYIPNGSIDAYAPLSLGGLHNKGFSSGFDTTLLDYTMIEYIESTGTQYIDTGLTMEKSTTMRMEISAQLTSNGNWAGVNGYMQHQASLGGGSKGLFVVDYNGNTHIENVYFNNTLKYTQDWTSAYSGAKNKVAVIGMGNAENTWWTNISANRYAQVGKWYYIKVYRSGTLVRDYVPCVRNSDGVAGLYDKVENKFYTNSGTGSFGSGAPTGDAVEEYKRVEHLDFTGSQYINTGIIPTANIKTESSFVAKSGDKWLFGSRTSYGSSDIYAFHITSGTEVWYQIKTNNTSPTRNVAAYFNNKSSLSTSRSAFTFNGQTFSGLGADALATSTWPMYIGSINTAGKADGGGGRNFVGELYSFKIWDGTTLVRDFVPVVRSRDGVAGLYDMVGHKFYANAGSGSFKTGGVIPADKGMSNGATMHYIGKSQVVATCIEDIFKRHFDITMSDATYYFEANKTRTIEINEELPAGVVVKYTWKKSSGETGSGNSFKDVGTYHVTATIAGGYYATTTATATLTIVRPSLSGITFTDKTYVYDGSPKGISISGKTDEELKAMNATVSYKIKGVNGTQLLVNNVPVDSANSNETIDAGTYEVTATIEFSGEGAGELKAYLTILKANYRVVLSNKTVTYNGNEHTLDVPDLTNKGMSIASSSVSGKELDSNHNPTKPVSATQNEGMVTRTNAGNYTITVNFNGGRNYNDTSSSASLIIQTANLTISFLKTNTYNGKGWEYDGTTHEVIATVSNEANVSISYSYSGTLSGSDNKFRDVGTYNLTATFNGGSNYYAASASVTFTITKANLSTTLNNETFVYTGSPHTYTLTNGIVGKGKEDGTFKVERCSIVYSYTGREFTASDTTEPTVNIEPVNGNTATNAGWYSTKLVITAPLSSNNIQNYNPLTITGKDNFKITRAPTSFNVGEVWVLSGTTFKNPVKSENVILQSGKFISSDSQKVEVRTNGGETSFYVTTKVVDRTSSTSASQVTITAQFNNYVSSSFVINLVPFLYSESSKTISSYTSSYGNIDGGVLFPHSVSASKMVDSVIQPKKSGLNTFTVDSVGGSSVLSTEYEYNRVEFSEGIVSVSGYWSFENAKINEIITPSTLTSFGNYAFKGSTAKTLTLKSSSITFNNNALSNMNSLKVIHNEKDLSNGYSLLKINNKVWCLSLNVLDENNINFSNTNPVSELKEKGHYYPIAENSVSVEIGSETFWYSTLEYACEDKANGQTAKVRVWRNITISRVISLNKKSKITLTADYTCTVTRARTNCNFFNVESGTTLKLESGIILDGYKSVYNGNTSTIIYVVSGEFVMNGGIIRNNRSNAGGAVYVNLGQKFNMTGGTIEGCNGLNSGGAIYNNGTFIMSGGTISNNFANDATNGKGGGIYNDDAGVINLNGGTIQQCESAVYGGGIYNRGQLKFSASASFKIQNNKSQRGGGIANESATLTANSGNNSTISGNSASVDGGGFYLFGDYNATDIRGISINNNTATWGAGIYFRGKAKVNLSDCSISSNTASENGGGIYFASGENKCSLFGCSLSSNIAKNGAGAFVEGGTYMRYSRGTVSSNTASANGGGIYVGNLADVEFGDSLQISFQIKSNKAYRGGGIYIDDVKRCRVYEDVEITNNTATQDGGGIFVKGNAQTSKNNSIFVYIAATVKYNIANYGGGIYFQGDNSNITSNPFSYNFAIGKITILYNTAYNKGSALFINEMPIYLESTCNIHGGYYAMNGGHIYVSGGFNNGSWRISVTGNRTGRSNPIMLTASSNNLEDVINYFNYTGKYDKRRAWLTNAS